MAEVGEPVGDRDGPGIAAAVVLPGAEVYLVTVDDGEVTLEPVEAALPAAPACVWKGNALAALNVVGETGGPPRPGV